MFFLSFDLGFMLPAALLGTLIALTVLAVLLFALHLCGFRLLWKKKAHKRREKAKDAIAIQETPEENELSEEELIVILTAAAVEALGGMDAKRFRVVAFRRL